RIRRSRRRTFNSAAALRVHSSSTWTTSRRRPQRPYRSQRESFCAAAGSRFYLRGALFDFGFGGNQDVVGTGEPHVQRRENNHAQEQIRNESTDNDDCEGALRVRPDAV